MSALEVYRDALLCGPQIKDMPKPAPLIDEMLDLDSTAFLYGRSGAGKTYVAFDWAMHVATDTWWNTKYVEPGKVLYVIAEGASGFGQRVEAWEKHHGCLAPAEFMCLPIAPNLYRPQTGAEHALLELAMELKPRLIVLDTVARCAVGAEENSARDMGIVVEQIDRLRRHIGACVLGVHHAGKDATAGLRGSSALLGAVDTVIRCDGAEGRVTLTVEKSRNHAAEGKAHLRLIPIADSLVLVPSERIDDGDELLASDEIALAALNEIAVDGGIAPNVWLKASGQSESTFYRARKRLLRLGNVKNVGTEQRPRYATVTVTPLSRDSHDSADQVTATTVTPLWGDSVAVDPSGSIRERCTEGIDL